MKKNLIVCTICLTSFVLISSCKKTSTNFINESLVIDTTAVLKYEGTFSPGPYGTVNGIARVYLKENKYTVALENFTSSNGPDLKVYISKERIPLNFIKLGNLRSTNGNQLYNVVGSPDFTQYKYVLIHCEQYNHLFGSAEIR